jgi:hypothetical protein
MDNFLANKILEDLLMGTLTASEAWANLRECKDSISDEGYDEIVTQIVHNLIESEVVDEEELENYKLEEILDQNLIEDFQLDFGSEDDDDWWLTGNDIY